MNHDRCDCCRRILQPATTLTLIAPMTRWRFCSWECLEVIRQEVLCDEQREQLRRKAEQEEAQSHAQQAKASLP